MMNIFMLALVFVPIFLGICWLGCNLVLKLAGMADDTPFVTTSFWVTLWVFVVFAVTLFGTMALAMAFMVPSWNEYLPACMGGSIGMGILVFGVFAVQTMRRKRQKS